MELGPRRRKRNPFGGIVNFSFVYDDHLHVSRFRLSEFSRQGCSEDQLLPLQRYDFSSAQWSGLSPVCVNSELEDVWEWRGPYDRRVGVSCAVLGDCAYVLGGYSQTYSHECPLHELNLEAMVWRRLEPKNKEQGPLPGLPGAGMVACGDEALCVFGGVGSPSTSYRLQPESNFARTWTYWLTNELHLFNIETGTWSSPETTGPRPPPCAKFSFTKFNGSRVILFGGEQLHKAVNEIHILDMENWHWSGAILPSSPVDLWPKERKSHSACLLFDCTLSIASDGSSESTPCTSASDLSTSHHKPQLFVLWGQRNCERVHFWDAWILDINSVIWQKVTVDLNPRSSIALGCHNRSQSEMELVVFGEFDHSWLSIYEDSMTQDNTTLLYLGMKTLYHVCVDYVAERYDLYRPLVQQLLPPHVKTDICQERDKRARYYVKKL